MSATDPTIGGGLRLSPNSHDVVEFVDDIPPKYRRPFQRSSVRWPERIVAQLRQQPGRWAIVRRGGPHENLSPYGNFLRREGAETITRQVSETETLLFARVLP
jgi:hypothetical protein